MPERRSIGGTGPSPQGGMLTVLSPPVNLNSGTLPYGKGRMRARTTIKDLVPDGRGDGVIA